MAIVGTAGFQAGRLIQAREARGLTAVSLAELIGVSPQTISQYEHEVQTPRPDVMNKLCGVLNLKRQFFIKKIVSKRGERIFYRSMASATKSARMRAESKYKWLQDVHEYLHEYFDFPQVHLPILDLPKDFRLITNDLIEKYAQECRKFFGIGDGPVHNLVKILEHNGVVVTRFDLLAETLDAFSDYPDAWRPFIVLGADKNIGVRSRFDAAHELGHLIMHRNIANINLASLKEFGLIEKQAHYFATAFLLPSREFSNDVWGISLDVFMSLKDRWRVSIAAMIKRCEALGMIDEDQTKKMWINLSRRGWRKTEPLDNTIKVEEPSMLKFCCETLIAEEIKTKEQIVDEIGLSANDIEEVANLPKGYLGGSTYDDINPMLKIRNGGNIIPFPKRS